MLKPEDIAEAKRKILIPEVEQAVDFMIALKWDGRESHFTQNELIDKIAEIKGVLGKLGDSNLRKELFDNHMLDFEDIYRAVGWRVYYNKPHYTESYPAYFVFSKKS